MMMNAKALAPVLALVAALTAAAPALAASEVIFYGYAKYVPVIDAVGSTLEVYGLAAPGSVAPPIAFDWANYEYTVQVSGLTVATYAADSVPVGPYLLDRKSSTYAGGIVRIYQDAKAGGTHADFAAPGTFSDGTLILTAAVDDGFASLLTDGPIVHDGIFVGSGSGTCDFNGGSRLDELVSAEYYLNDWFLGGVPISDPSPTVPAGFQRLFNVKLVSPNDPTSAEPGTWSGVKALYR
ncbi:MAG: hypothetical protein ACYDIE_02045 [Candidatus Krumholzibacteriia bacterium]